MLEQTHKRFFSKERQKVNKEKKQLILLFIAVNFFLSFYSNNFLFAQNVSNYIRIGGSINLSDNFYSSSGIDRRQPANVARGIFRTTITIYDQIQLPFELYISSQERKFQQPFNQFGVSPRISDWLTLHAGYFSSRISDYTFGDLRLLGGGIELTPGNFKLKFLYGRSRTATESNSLEYFPGIYKQNVYAASVGYGNESVAFFTLNLFHAKDDSNSIKRDSLTAKPAENLVTSLRLGFQLIEELSIQSEVAVAAYSNNLSAERLSDLNFPEFFFTPNTSTRVDGAAKVQLFFKPSNYWSLRLTGQWIGPGFTTLGYSLMPNDLMEFSAAPSVKLLDNKLTMRAQAGVRYNNLRNNRLSSTSRFTGSFGLNWQISKIFGFDLNYNNNQIKSSHSNDTLKLSNVFNSITVSPRFMFEEFGGMNNLNLNYSYQNSLDKNILTSQYSNNKTHSAGIIHSIAFPSTWSFTTSVMFNKSITSFVSTQILNFSENVSRRFLDNKLNITLGGGINFIKTTVNDSQFFFTLNSNYSLDKFGSIGFTLSNNSYRADSELTKTYNELYGSLQYNISF
ncbi:MAG: hypothetical protein WHT45_02500 [Ignavibacterium sp.]